jgi:hypothetical protein
MDEKNKKNKFNKNYNEKKNMKKKIKNKNKKVIKDVEIIKKDFFSNKFGRKIDENTLSYNKTLDIEEKNEDVQNLCLECGIDMGPHNPRQLCGKTQCDYV